MMLSALAYAADVAILGTYFRLSRGGRARPFHVANAVGAMPLLAIEVMQRAWPVIPVTVAFGLIGWYGWIGGKD